ncbi:MAG: neutral zinc metallopeptidase [Propionibacteriaceae bacterium]|nr:neutral zinc metallopeptidase [Propionibacteriaceae bacterium]
MSPTGPFQGQNRASFPPPQPGQTPVSAPWANTAPSWNQPPSTAWSGGVPPWNQTSTPWSNLGSPGYQTGPWTLPATGAAARPPTRKPSWLPRIIGLVVFFLIVAPALSSYLNQVNQPTYPTPVDPQGQATAATSTATNTTSSNTGVNPGGSNRYTPGPPDRNPKAPPLPKTEAEVVKMLTQNPIYAQGLTATACTITDIDLRNAPISAIEAHMNGFVDCLMAAWFPPVVDSGFELPHPSVTVYTSKVTSACGELPLSNAVYCSADQQIYYAADLIEAFPANLQTMRFLAESVIAHEFGHTIQYRTMILISESVLEENASSDADKEDTSRRLEMQADCFAGLFLNSVSQSAGLGPADQQNIVALFRSLGGDIPYADDHGTGSNRAAWVTTGLTSSTVGVCETYTVAPDKVG